MRNTYPKTVVDAATAYASWNAIHSLTPFINRLVGERIINKDADAHVVYLQLGMAQIKLRALWYRIALQRVHQSIDELHRILWVIAATTHCQQLAAYNPIVQEECGIKPPSDTNAIQQLITAIFLDQAIAVEGWQIINNREVVIRTHTNAIQAVATVVGMEHAKLLVQSSNQRFLIEAIDIRSIYDT